MSGPAIRTMLAIGATGSIGTHVVDEALSQGLRVRALVRDEKRASAILPAGLELVRGDVNDVASLAAAVEGIDAIVITWGGDARTVDYEGMKNLVAAFGAARPRVALMTSMSSSKRSEAYGGLANWKRATERLLRASGVDYTIVRPGWFDYEGPGERALLVEQGDNSPVESHRGVARTQIAATLVHALFSEAAVAVTLELFAQAGTLQTDWDGVFAPLVKDDLDELAGGRDHGVRLADEPAEVIADIEAIRAR